MVQLYQYYYYLQANELAKKFAGQAMQLQKIANFHNTIGDRMIAR